MYASARTTDPDRFYPRSNRLIHDSFGWWVRLREGDRGPFPARRLAEVHLEEFMASLRLSEAA